MQAISRDNSQKIANMGLLCAALVVLIHTYSPRVVGSPAWMLHYVVRYGLATIAVPFFFLVSGYFLAGHISEKGWWKCESIKRIRTLLVPYFLWLILKLIWLWGVLFAGHLLTGHAIAAAKNANSFGYWAGALGFTLTSASDALWYIRALFIFVLISPLLFWYVWRTKCVGLGIIFLIYYFVNPGHVGTSWLVSSGKWLDFWRFGVPIEGLFYFSVGLYVRGKGIVINRRIAFVCGVVGTGLAIVRMKLCIATLPEPIPMVALTIPLILIAVWSIMPCCRIPSAVTSLAFPVYVIHTSVVLIHSSFVGLKMGGRNETVSGLAFGWAFNFFVSMFLAACLKKVFPRFTRLAFGGR